MPPHIESQNIAAILARLDNLQEALRDIKDLLEKQNGRITRLEEREYGCAARMENIPVRITNLEADVQMIEKSLAELMGGIRTIKWLMGLVGLPGVAALLMLLARQFLP